MPRIHQCSTMCFLVLYFITIISVSAKLGHQGDKSLKDTLARIKGDLMEEYRSKTIGNGVSNYHPSRQLQGYVEVLRHTKVPKAKKSKWPKRGKKSKSSKKNNAIAQARTIDITPSPTVSPSAAPSHSFVLNECYTYKDYWKRDMFNTCDENFENCQCAGAQRRIDAGDIDCETALCPRGCAVCIYCLMEVIEGCANGYYFDEITSPSE